MLPPEYELAKNPQKENEQPTTTSAPPSPPLPPPEREYPIPVATPIEGIPHIPHIHESVDWNPLQPFATVEQWKVTRTAVEENISKKSFDKMIKRDCLNPKAQIESANHMYKLIEAMDGGVSGRWIKDTMDVENVQCEFWYRDPIDCIGFIIGHAPFEKHLSYAPAKDYDEKGRRVYHEMWSGNWWWREQVISLLYGALL
jgi:hypothetical protein